LQPVAGPVVPGAPGPLSGEPPARPRARSPHQRLRVHETAEVEVNLFGFRVGHELATSVCTPCCPLLVTERPIRPRPDRPDAALGAPQPHPDVRHINIIRQRLNDHRGPVLSNKKALDQLQSSRLAWPTFPSTKASNPRRKTRGSSNFKILSRGSAGGKGDVEAFPN
jgi:hypothetical protein